MKTLVERLRSMDDALDTEAADRIEELEAKVTTLELIEKHLLQCCKDHKSRIKALGGSDE